MNTELLLQNLRVVPDFPIKGIQFYDVTTLFKNPACVKELGDALYELYKDKGITKVVGIESRGFILGSILAERLNAGIILARKPGKLPAEVYEESYGKEYGKDVIQIHKDAITEDDVVLIHDDLIAEIQLIDGFLELFDFRYRVVKTDFHDFLDSELFRSGFYCIQRIVDQ